ncbi:pimeloyl-ACP methyl ester carboxylesterase [Bradyrhizobium sp. AZCC 1577]|uniref:alpha/beta fold hydrolase n=1 Tax=Bradyrhizobium sp. AZCC 1577 TaxID=3117019 RepID=UPI002FF1E3BC
MALVLVPGFMLDWEMWASFEPEMEEFRPIVHADLASDDDVPAMARRLIADAPARFVLIGFSFGGYVAREAARLAPNAVEALVLVATSSRADTPDQAQRKIAAAALATLPFRGMSRGSLRASVHPDRRSDDELIGRLQGMGRRLGLEAFRRQSNLARPSDVDRLGEIACPTLVVAAEDDELRSLDEARELHAGIPRSRLAIVPASGHMLPMEQPAALARLVKSWLLEAPSAAAVPIRPRP